MHKRSVALLILVCSLIVPQLQAQNPPKTKTETKEIKKEEPKVAPSVTLTVKNFEVNSKLIASYLTCDRKVNAKAASKISQYLGLRQTLMLCLPDGAPDPTGESLRPFVRDLLAETTPTKKLGSCIVEVTHNDDYLFSAKRLSAPEGIVQISKKQKLNMMTGFVMDIKTGRIATALSDAVGKSAAAVLQKRYKDIIAARAKNIEKTDKVKLDANDIKWLESSAYRFENSQDSTNLDSIANPELSYFYITSEAVVMGNNYIANRSNFISDKLIVPFAELQADAASPAEELSKHFAAAPIATRFTLKSAKINAYDCVEGQKTPISLIKGDQIDAEPLGKSDWYKGTLISGKSKGQVAYFKGADLK